MRFLNKTGYPAINKTIDQINEVLQPSSQMINYILTKRDWRYGVRSSEEVAYLLSHLPTSPIPIEMYYAENPRSSQTATWNGLRIGINQYWYPTATPNSVASALIHEWAHACGFNHIDKGFPQYLYNKFANFWTKNKSLYSVPYHLSDNIHLWIQ